MDFSCQSEDLQVGSKVEFPLWLANALKNLQNPAVNIDISNIYKEETETADYRGCVVFTRNILPFSIVHLHFLFVFFLDTLLSVIL